MIVSPPLVYRRINPQCDLQLAFANYRDATVVSLGRDSANPNHYLPWLQSRIEEFPDGHLMVYLGDECVGQLEMQVPYGLSRGYINLFYVGQKFRRQGMGRAIHARAEQYFRSWEATRIELDCAPPNEDAVCFYLAMGYRFSPERSPYHPLRRMSKDLPSATPPAKP